MTISPLENEEPSIRRIQLSNPKVKRHFLYHLIEGKPFYLFIPDLAPETIYDHMMLVLNQSLKDMVMQSYGPLSWV